MDTTRVPRLAWTAAAVLLLTLLLSPAPARGALWYDFNEPYATATSSPVMVFDWSAEKCFNEDIPDQPARAFRDASGQVTLIDTGSFARRKLGSTLGNVTHVCPTIFSSTASPDPSTWDNGEWLASPYTTDGNTVYALIHNEYQGWRYGQGYCVKPGELWPDKMKCWYNSITLAKSTDGGATYANSPSPTQYVGSIPYRYMQGVGPSGFFTPSNIVRAKDGYLYVILHVEGYGAQQTGACLWRTRDLADPRSWRAWGGAGFTVRFLDPYRNTITDPSQHVCAPIGPTTVQTGSDSLTWNTYFKKWLLARAGGEHPGGFYTYTSDDLINWSPATLMMSSYVPWNHTCGDPDYNLYPSLLDPATKTRNFERTGQRPYLFFTHFNVAYNSGGCWMSVDRDLLRIPIEFSNQQPGGPSAALAASTTSPRIGEPVAFDASGSRDADGSIVRYEWDLDGDGTYERDTGTDPTTRAVYTAPDVVTVTVRVSDDDGKATDETRDVRVDGAPLDTSAAAAPASAPVTQAGGAPAAAIGRIRVIGAVRARPDGSVAHRVRVPAAGRLLVRGVRRGARIRSASAFADGPGTVSLWVRPSRRGRALLGRRARVRVKAVIEFNPVGGAPQAETRTLVLRAKRY